MNRKLQALAVILALAAMGAAHKKAHQEDPKSAPPACRAEANCELRFSPNGGCTAAIVDEINKAEKSILVMAYSFTSDPIAKALVKADRRGIEVKVIIDSGRVNESYGDSFQLNAGGAEVWSDPVHAIQHQKVIIIDPGTPRGRVIMGSFNFTGAAEDHNSENIIIIQNEKIAQTFETNWNEHKQHSKPYEPPAAAEVGINPWAYGLAAVMAGLLAVGAAMAYRRISRSIRR